jgi:hypothetical protein
VKTKHEIQKVSLNQIVIVLSFIGMIILMIFFLKDVFGEKPDNLWELLKLSQIFS